MSDAIQRGAAEDEVPKHEERLTGAWRQMRALKRRYEKRCKVSDIEDCTHKQQYGITPKYFESLAAEHLD